MTLRRKKDPSRSETPQPMKQFNPSLSTMNRSNVAPEQSAKIQAAAAALRENRTADGHREKLVSSSANYNTKAFTLQPVVVSEATSAMKWANQYDKHAIRDAYLQGKPTPKTPTAEQREESSPPPPLPLKDSPVLPPPSPKINKNSRNAVVPPTSPTGGRDSPVTERPSSMNASPGSQASSIHSATLKTDRDGKNKVTRLRAMFGKKEAEAQQTRLTPPKPMERKLSIRKQPTPAPVQVSMPARVEPEPTLTVPAEAPRPASAADRRQQEEEAKRSFSNFDQGPLEDMPAFVPESPRIQTASPERKQTPEPIRDDVSEPTSPSPANQEPPAMEDRWAQIRRNAAERAKAAPKQPATPVTRGSIDDGETSGEESKLYPLTVHVYNANFSIAIEARVARIKARVAELTSNPDVAPRHPM